MSKLTHQFTDAMHQVRRQTGAPLSFLHKAFLKESLGGARPVSSYRFRNEICAGYHPARKPEGLRCH